MAKHRLSRAERFDPIGYDGLACPMTIWGTYDKPKWWEMTKTSTDKGVEYGVTVPVVAGTVFTTLMATGAMLTGMAVKRYRR